MMIHPESVHNIDITLSAHGFLKIRQGAKIVLFSSWLNAINSRIGCLITGMPVAVDF